ncbi:hypothetical protein ABWH92_12905 [Ahrensia marina]|uniref:hypothetical protein n=1 Tax=Ahrensia marina TaxID=1514904 RepID=UPI0035D0D6E0
MGKAQLSVWQSASGAVLLSALEVRLPVVLGRHGPNDAGRLTDADGKEVLFGSDLATLSRHHMDITVSDTGGATVIDRSSNGVQRKMPGEPNTMLGKDGEDHLPIGSQRQYETVGLVIEINLPHASRPLEAGSTGQKIYAVYDSASAGRPKAIDLTDGYLCLVRDANSVRMERQIGPSAGDVLQSVKDARQVCLAVVGRDDDGRTVVLPGQNRSVVCNRRALPEHEPFALAHMDTLEIGGMDLRIMEEGGEQPIVCVNPDCRQMNAYEVGGNCRYCGTRLGDGRTQKLPLGT